MNFIFKETSIIYKQANLLRKKIIRSRSISFTGSLAFASRHILAPLDERDLFANFALEISAILGALNARLFIHEKLNCFDYFRSPHYGLVSAKLLRALIVELARSGTLENLQHDRTVS